MTGKGRVSRRHRLSATVRNCTRDEGGPFETGSQVQVSSHRKLLSSRAMVASVAETSGPDRNKPHIPFERYADDAICHCKSAEEARALWSALQDRFAACKL